MVKCCPGEDPGFWLGEHRPLTSASILLPFFVNLFDFEPEPPSSLHYSQIIHSAAADETGGPNAPSSTTPCVSKTQNTHTKILFRQAPRRRRHLAKKKWAPPTQLKTLGLHPLYICLCFVLRVSPRDQIQMVRGGTCPCLMLMMMDDPAALQNPGHVSVSVPIRVHN